MTPEEKKKHFEELLAKRMRKKAEKEKEARDREIKAKDAVDILVPQLLAHQKLIFEHGVDKPSPEMIAKLREISRIEELTSYELKKKHFKMISDEAWGKVVTYLLREEIVNQDDLALKLHEKKKERIKVLQQRVLYLRAKLKAAEDYDDEEKRENLVNNKRTRPVFHEDIVEKLQDAEDEFWEAEKDFTGHAQKIAASQSNKTKGGNVTINLSTPRPDKVVKEVTSSVVDGVLLKDE